jgi:hypothetical protein
MVNSEIPYVAVIGGFWELRSRDPAAFAAAKKMASELGTELAKSKMGLVVYYSDEDSLEPYVVSGYVPALPAGAEKCIRVRFADSQRNSVRFSEQLTRSEVFDPSLFPGKDWEAPFYRSLAEADGVDAVLLMAGARSTLIAGQIAIARSLPILAIETFDGSANTIRTELAFNALNYPAATTNTPRELVAWLKAKTLANAKEQETRRLQEVQYKKYVVQSQKARWLAGAFVALLGTLYVGTARAPGPPYYPFLMLLGLIAAGATGALVRSVIWGAEETAPSMSFLLGGIAGFVVGLADLIPQWVGAQELLSPSTAAIGAGDKIQFVSAALVAISGGVGFDTIFTRLKKQTESQAVTVDRKGR